MNAMDLDVAVKGAILASGIFVWVGMLTGVWKYWQIRHSQQARAHYYVDIPQRIGWLYARASLIRADMAVFS